MTVYDIVAFARSEGILCQGRGSAANSAVCYCLAITEVDPSQSQLLFERFISMERNEPPDIDVDFEHQRERKLSSISTGNTAGTGLPRCHGDRLSPAQRPFDVGKALGFEAAFVEKLARQARGLGNEVEAFPSYSAPAAPIPWCPRAAAPPGLVSQLLGAPSPPSQHVGAL